MLLSYSYYSCHYILLGHKHAAIAIFCLFKVEEAVVVAEKEKQSAELRELEKQLRNGFAQASQHS